MSTLAKPKLLLPVLILLVALALAVPVAAQATLAYVQTPRLEGRANSVHPSGPHVMVAADDGSEAERVGTGHSPRVSPDGLSVAFLHEGGGHAQELKLVQLADGAIRTLMVGWREPFYLAFSPDSKTIAALRGPEIGKRNLVLIDVATGLQSVVANGYFSGFSFSPDGTEIAYSRAGSEKYPPRSDVFRFPVPIPGVVNVRAPEAVRLTSDHRSSDPLWGPQKMVFVKTLGKNRKYGPKNELFLMNPRGKGVKRLTHTKVPAAAAGPVPDRLVGRR